MFDAVAKVRGKGLTKQLGRLWAIRITLVIGTASVGHAGTSADQTVESVSCDQWGTPQFSEGADAAITSQCLSAGANPNAADSNDNTPLHWAVIDHNAAVIDALIRAGADPNAANSEGQTPLHSAARGRATILDILIRAGADPNAVDRYGWTPLHITAIWGENAEAVGSLKYAGADLEARDNFDGTPLHAAAGSSNAPAIVSALIDAGADIYARKADGTSVLHSAAMSQENLQIFRVLVNAGASVDTRNEHGRTPLHIVSANDNSGAAVDALMAFGAKVNARDEGGNTALHVAAHVVAEFNEFSNAGDAIKALLRHGANPLARNADDETPWDIVSANKAFKAEQSEAYWLLNDARFEQRSSMPEVGSGRPVSLSVGSPQPPCELPGFPDIADLEGIGLPWCSSRVDVQVRAFALQAAGTWCGIATGTSSTAEQLTARRLEIKAACEQLDALSASLSRGSSVCRCPEWLSKFGIGP